MQRRGIVHLKRVPCSIPKFDWLQPKKIATLPQPFLSADVDLRGLLEPRAKTQLNKLLRLCPPLLVTKYFSGGLFLHLVIPFIIRCSSTLEYLKLFCNYSKTWEEPLNLDPKQTFPKLRHLCADAWYVGSCPNGWIHFPVLVAWIAKGSPSLETYESKLRSESEFASNLCLQVDIQNVKTLTLLGYRVNPVAFQHFLSIPFQRLRSLKVTVVHEDEPHFLPSPSALATTLTKCANSLTTLDLSCFKERITLDLALPVCSNVRELSLFTFTSSDDIIFICFPALQVLNIHQIKIVESSSSWDNPLPFFELKTLRIWQMNSFFWNNDYTEKSFKLLERFPGLERLNIPSIMLNILMKQSVGDPRVPSLLGRLKHLELQEQTDYISLAVLKGTEAIKMKEFSDLIPVKDLPCLKLVQFPWTDNCSNITKLLKLAGEVKRVVISNCCSIPRVGTSGLNKALKKFFASVSNAECGCKDGKETVEGWY